MSTKLQKTHNYKMLKTYTVKQIKAYGSVEFFLDPEVTDKKIKLRRAHVLNEVGYQCCEEGCKLKDFYFGLGVDKGGGIHLDLYGIDQEGETVMVTIDHIKPRSKGGKDDIKNYRPLCKIHNEIKSNYHSFNRKFKDLSKIYPDDEMISQNYRIYKSVQTQEHIDNFKKNGGFLAEKYLQHFVSGEEHVFLYKRDHGVMMSTHQSETISNQDFINQAYGDVIIFGLGLGMIIFPLLDDKDIKKITVVEMDHGVIDMVGKLVKAHDHDNKLTIIPGDAFTYHENIKGKHFDTIYFDIWIKINEEAYAEMENLHDLYRKFMKSTIGSYMHSWCYEMKEEYMSRKSVT